MSTILAIGIGLVFGFQRRRGAGGGSPPASLPEGNFFQIIIG